MADEVVKIIKIETGGSEQTVKGLKEEINSLRDALLNTEKGSEEYNNILKQLIDDQVRLTDAMRAGQKEATAAEGSYNALVNKMAALKKVWRETTDEVKRKEIGKEIKSINDDLKKLDASIGDFRRTVGDYTNSITSAFSSMGGAAKGMIGPINGVKTAFSALSSHPLIAVLTGLAALLINGISNGFKSSEENMNKLRVAFSGFKAIGDAVVNLFQGLAGWVAKVAEGAMNLADKLGLVTPKMKERQELTKKQIELEQKERKSLEDKAKLEKDSAELRAKAADKETYTAKQRIEFLKEAQAKDEEILGIEKDILEAKLAQAEAEGELTGNSSEENQKLAELRAQVVEVDAKIQQSRANANRQLSRMYKEDLSNRTKAITETLNLEKELLQQEYDLAAEGSDEQLRLAKELRTKELEIQKAGFKEKYKNRDEYNKAVKLAEKAFNNDMEVIEGQAFNKRQERESRESQIRLLGLKTGSKEYVKIQMQEIKEKSNTLVLALQEAEAWIAEQIAGGKNEDDLVDTIIPKFGKKYNDMLIELGDFKNKYNQLYDDLTQITETEIENWNQITLNATTPLSKYYSTQYNQLKDTYDRMQRLYNETPEQFKLRQDAVWKSVIDALVNWKSAVDTEFGTWRGLQNSEHHGIWWLDGEMFRLKDDVAKFGDEYETAMADIQNIVITDAERISQNLMKKYEELGGENGYGWMVTSYFGGLLPTPENIKKLIGDDFDFNALFKLVQEGLIPQEAIDRYIESLSNLGNAEKALLDQRIDNWMNLANGIGQVMGGISDLYEENLKAQVKNGNMSQEQAEKEFENTIKPMRIAEATINTISGAIAAFMGYQELGQPWGGILGAIQAAAVTAAGIAQIKQIEATKFGGGGSSVNTSALAQVTPVMPDFAPEMTGTLTGQQETEELANAIAKTPIWVSVQDIDDAQERGRVRVQESSW